ncbi:MAG: hypothetical protein AABY26_00040 [Nanoarchaeota archaeon]
MTHQFGDKVNIYQQDFTNVRAYATTLAGQVFFENIEGGAVLHAAGAYSEEEQTVYLGKLSSEKDGIIELSDALIISPMQLRGAQEVTNYSGLDTLRALYHDVRVLAPEILTTHQLKRENVRTEKNLENKL